MDRTSTIEIPAHQDILQYTAEFIFATFDEQLPDLSRLFVLLPHSQLTQPFNEALSQSLSLEVPAIIPPWAGTLRSWAQQFSRNQFADFQIINEHARQLLFIEALQQHPDLFKEENKWQVTQALLKFFDELSLNQKQLFASAQDWQDKLKQAYGIEQQDFEHLQYESKLVYTLWHAWQQQLTENSLFDETADYISRLSTAPALIDKQQHFICLGLSAYSKAEQVFIEELLDKGQCHVFEIAKTLSDNIVSDDIKSDFTLTEFISETFSRSGESIKQRARCFADKHGEVFSAEPPFSTYMASEEEEQIRAIDYFVREKILQGKNRIAVISEDRKLSRRLRALLERADVQLQDKAGWSLATTQAASIIERWLECIEEDFSAYPLLDCLKSPYLSNNESTTDFKQNIYRFEHDLIFHENVSSNIAEYKRQLKNRLKRLSHWPEKSYKELIDTLDFIEDSASALLVLHKPNKKIRLSEFLQTLLDSLQQLGVLQNYQDDAAGLILLKTFESLKQGLEFSDPVLNWQDCRTWLGMALESQHFTPPTNSSVVQLMTLDQASCLHFDCIIIAAAESQHFPGSANSSPLFNQSVRASLGLVTWETQREQRHELFNQLLLSAPEILFTACNEEKGEAKPVSPWLELLISFYQLAYPEKFKTGTFSSESLDNQALRELVRSKAEVFVCDEKELPAPAQTAASVLPDDLVPERVSASSYQRIINCPYQYFSADGLRLKPLEELSDELKKSDYGELVHAILQAFHSGHDRYGKAFEQAVTADNRHVAEDHLLKISETAFLAKLDNNVLHRSWLYRWQKHIPAYINWQIQHQLDWTVYQSEKILESELLETGLDATIKLYGRLDRIDRNKEDNSHAIIDYKTGSTARQQDVDSGENIQLSTYALLDETASEVSYLSVDSSQQKVESKASLSGEDLQQNRELNKLRLGELFKQIKNNEPLPAWGDDMVCRYCNFSGLCRKAQWKE